MEAPLDGLPSWGRGLGFCSQNTVHSEVALDYLPPLHRDRQKLKGPVIGGTVAPGATDRSSREPCCHTAPGEEKKNVMTSLFACIKVPYEYVLTVPEKLHGNSGD